MQITQVLAIAILSATTASGLAIPADAAVSTSTDDVKADYAYIYKRDEETKSDDVKTDYAYIYKREEAANDDDVKADYAYIDQEQ